MSSNFLIYYLFRLIKDGHEWQYKNLNGKGNKPKLYFSFLQIIAIFVSILFVLEEPNGLSSNATEQILSCLSIMVALFLALFLLHLKNPNKVILKKSPLYPSCIHGISFISLMPLHHMLFYCQF